MIPDGSSGSSFFGLPLAIHSLSCATTEEYQEYQRENKTTIIWFTFVLYTNGILQF
jgi:hypothetical protein